MDIATLIGLLGGFGIIMGAIATGGDILLFLNLPSILIVVGGTFMITLMQVSLADFLGSFAIGIKAFMYKVDDPKLLIDRRCSSPTWRARTACSPSKARRSPTTS